MIPDNAGMRYSGNRSIDTHEKHPHYNSEKGGSLIWPKICSNRIIKTLYAVSKLELT